MPKALLDKFAIGVPCLVCGQEIKKTVGWFKKDGQRCPHCGAGLHTEEFRKEITRAERSVEAVCKPFAR